MALAWGVETFSRRMGYGSFHLSFSGPKGAEFKDTELVTAAAKAITSGFNFSRNISEQGMHYCSQSHILAGHFFNSGGTPRLICIQIRNSKLANDWAFA